MTTTQAATTPPAYDNNGQYTRTGILRYERIFGDGYVSTGGPETTEPSAKHGLSSEVEDCQHNAVLRRARVRQSQCP